jgi:endonuclease G
MRLRTILIALVFLIAAAFASPYLLRAGKWISAFNKGVQKTAESQKDKGPGPDALTLDEAKKIYLSPGNPSNAASDDRDNFLLVNSAYALSYNNRKGIANWVAWRLTKTDSGDAERQNDFRPDPRLPGGWTIVDLRDYSSSGYERGHLCPSADRSSSSAINSETFLMTNIAPQVHGLNGGPWEKLERYSRSMARRDANLYIIAGQYGSKGKIDGRIIIPSNFWKVIVVIENGGDISSADSGTRVIAVDMPNDNAIETRNWRGFTVTVRSIEEKTGCDLLSNLPRKLQDVLETKTDPRSEK